MPYLRRSLLYSQIRDVEKSLAFWTVVLCIIFLSSGFATQSSASTLEEWQKSVVQIIIKRGGEFNSGSGFIVNSKEGYVVTNAHVVADEMRQTSTGNFEVPSLPAEQIIVRTYNNERYPVQKVMWRSGISLKVIGLIPEQGPNLALDCGKDLAILKVGPMDAPPLSIASSGTVRAGDRVLVMGYPELLKEVLGAQQPVCEVSEGIIGGPRVSPNDTRVFTTDAAVNRGNSGGPMINERGQVVAVISEIAGDYFSISNQVVSMGASLGMAIQSDELVERLRQLGVDFTYIEHRPGVKRIVVVSLSVLAAVALIGCAVIGLLLARRTWSKRSPVDQAQNTVEGVLRGISGEYRGSCLPIGSGIRIGRDPNLCNLILNKNTSRISRCHAEIRFNPNTAAFVLADSQSRGGTFLSNGRQVPFGKPALLHDGDGFYLVDRDCEFRVEQRKDRA